MSGCVRTGFVFRSPGAAHAFTGDLFYVDGGWQIRGTNPHPADGRPLDAMIAVTRFFRRASGVFSDSEPGVQLLSVSAAFRAHVAEWQSAAAFDALPADDISDAEAA